MFADEDFDPDEDFFNDLTQKETQYYSQEFNSIEKGRVKRFKQDDNSFGLSRSNISNLVEPIHSNFGGDRLAPNTNDSGGDQSDRRKLILERLKRCKNTDSVPSTDQRSDKTNSNSLTSQLAPDPATLNFQSVERNNGKCLAASTDSPDNKSCPNLIKNVDSSTSKLDVSNKNRNSPYKGSKPFTKPVTLVREFPGPAGLLPNSSSRINPPVSLNSSCSNDGMDIDVEKKSFAISKYCSQNTTNSFMDGPWQSLMDDMGDDFLRGHEISMIKCKAVGNLYKNDKVPYLVGKVQRVDFNYLGPVIELKDYTGTIQGTVCKDIFVDYPQLLDVGNVWFLQNVGLLTTGDTMRNAHVIIALKNVVNVYTVDSKFFNKSEMEARLENFNADSDPSEPVLNRESESSCFANTKMGHRPNTDCGKKPQNMKPPLRPGDSKNACTSTNTLEKVALRTSATHGRKNLFSDNHVNPISPQAELNPSQSIEHKSNKFTFESEEFEDFDNDDIDSLFSGIDNDMASKTPTNIDSAKNIKTGESKCVSMTQNTKISGKNTVLNTVHLNTRLSEQSEQSVSKVTSVTIEKAAKIQGRDPVVTKENCNLPKTSSIALKLSVFRSEAALTPPSSKELDLATTTDIHQQKEPTGKSSLTSVSLLNRENDSDEELFSQVDIESVFSRYDNPND